jgi:hypothetical protein
MKIPSEDGYYVACLPSAPGSQRGVHQYVLFVGTNWDGDPDFEPHVLACGKEGRIPAREVLSWSAAAPSPTRAHLCMSSPEMIEVQL